MEDGGEILAVANKEESLIEEINRNSLEEEEN